MRKLYALAAASVLFLGLSSTAVAAPVIVTYGLSPTGATASYVPNCQTGATCTPGSVPLGGQMVVVYTSGTLAPGGILGSVGAMQGLNMLLYNSWSIYGGLAGTNAMAVGFSLAGTRTLGGARNFVGATYRPGSPGNPPTTPSVPPFNGNANINFAPIGTGGTILINGAGTQSVMGIAFNWTVGQVVGVEIAPRVFVPEPGTALLLLGGLTGLAGLAGGARRLRR